MEASPVSLKFPFTFQDRLKAGLAVTATCWGCLTWTVAPSVMGILLLLTHLHLRGHIPPGQALIAVALVLVMPAFIVWNTWRAHKAFADTPAHAYTFSSEGVRSRSAHTEVSQDWTVIRSIRVRGGFLMLFFTTQCAHCIPLRCLAPEQIGAIAGFARAGGVRRVDV